MFEKTPAEEMGPSGSSQKQEDVPSWFSTLAMVIGWVALGAGVFVALVSFEASSEFGNRMNGQEAVLMGMGIGSLFAGAVTFVFCLGVAKALDHLEAIRKAVERTG